MSENTRALSQLNADQRKYAVRLMATAFHRRFSAHEDGQADSADKIGAENALAALEEQFWVTKKDSIPELVELHEGDTVKFVGCTVEQAQWGGNRNPHKDRVPLGMEGILERKEVHTWHTKVWVRFSNGGDDALLGPYNSVCFEKVN